MQTKSFYTFSQFVTSLSLCLAIFSTPTLAETQPNKYHALITTNLGQIKIELNEQSAPATVANFIQYARSGFYNDTIFHRVIPGFMIQGGGFDSQMSRKTTNAPIKNESTPKLPNLIGTIAMARTSDPHSATSQFFINVADNHSLNRTLANPGYAVFGKVIEGMSSVYAISNTPTTTKQRMQNVPVSPIIIESVTVTP